MMSWIAICMTKFIYVQRTASNFKSNARIGQCFSIPGTSVLLSIHGRPLWLVGTTDDQQSKYGLVERRTRRQPETGGLRLHMLFRILSIIKTSDKCSWSVRLVFEKELSNSVSSVRASVYYVLNIGNAKTGNTGCVLWTVVRASSLAPLSLPNEKFDSPSIPFRSGPLHQLSLTPINETSQIILTGVWI